MKKINAFLCSLLLLFVSALGAVPSAHAVGTNLITNPSAEDNVSSKPTGWNSDTWGTNTTAFSYAGTGHTGAHSLTTSVSKYTSGDSKWDFTPVSVTPNTSYTFSDWYQGTVSTNVDLVVTNTAGQISYIWLDNPAISAAWKQNTYTFTTPANAAKVTIYHSISKVGQLSVDDYSLVNNSTTTTPPTAPTVSITAPAASSTVSGTVNLTANATDTLGVAGVAFKLDNVTIGLEDVTSPYSVSWDSKTVANGNHTLSATARNTSGLTTTSTITVNVQNVVAPTAPTVNITAPVAGSTVTGTVSLSANASDAVAVSSVQFKVDGTNVGAVDTTSPYSVSWDSKTIADGSHTVTAVATNSSNLTTTSSPVTVTVSNPVAPPPPPTTSNLITNPSFETAQSTTVPANWLSSSWGTNTSAFSYLTTGHTGTHSVKVQTTQYSSGSANWYYNDVPVTAGKTYQYSNWYQSNVDTEVDAEVTMSNGTVQYFYLGTVFANTNWTQFKTTFTAPAGAKSMAIYQILAKVGYVVSDDYSLGEYTPQPYSRGIVTINFDDGWANQYQNANPVLKALGIKATYYIISGELTDQPDYMTGTQVKDLYANGNEIGSHSVTHPDLTTLTATQMKNEMANSQTTLQNLIGAPVTNFAYPFGAYNQATITTAKQYYASQRTVNGGYNTKDNLDVTQLKMYEVDSNISQAQVKAWIDGAIAQHVWLILTYHEVANTPSAADDALYTTLPSDFSAEMNYLKSTGVSTQTVKQALAEIQAQ